MTSPVWSPHIVMVVEDDHGHRDAMRAALGSSMVTVGGRDRDEFDIRTASSAVALATPNPDPTKPRAVVLGQVERRAEVCKKIRALHAQDFIIVLGEDAEEALAAGADQHQVKDGPWAAALPARVRAGLRWRGGGGLPPRLRWSGFVVDTVVGKVVLPGVAGGLTLNPRELGLLVCLHQAGGDVVDRNTLLAELWPEPVNPETLTKLVSRLRERLDTLGKGLSDQIVTVGTGYARGPEGRAVVLVADDTDRDRDDMVTALNGQFDVVEADTADKTIAMWKEKVPDVVLLDVDFGDDFDGRSVTQAIRGEGDTQTYIINVTLVGTALRDVRQNLLVGANEYHFKHDPWLEALPARVEAGLRARGLGGWSARRIACGGFTYDQLRRMVIPKTGDPVRLSAEDITLLEKFLANKGGVLDYVQLIRALFGRPIKEGDQGTVNQAVCRLRDKLGDQHRGQLKTVRGSGYKLDCQ